MFRALVTCTALAIAACATTAPPAPVASNATAQKRPCAPEATRLPQKECGPGSTYDQKDVSSTGQTSAGSAVDMLDPRIYSH
jgi:hypothetical protein